MEEPGRHVSDGSYHTVDNSVVSFSTLGFKVKGVSFYYSGGSGSGVFDPSKPPSPYSNCHGGHCHLPDGSTKDYSEIEAEMKGGGSFSGVSVSGECLSEFLLISQGAESTFPASECIKGLDLEQGEIVAIRVVLSDITMRGSVRQENGEEAGFDIAYSGERIVEGKISGKAGRGEPYRQRFRVILEIGGGFTDAIRGGDVSEEDINVIVDAFVSSIHVFGE